ncbi:hypothetical protein [Sodalis glossinidius]|uniref:hypothetical protein n=1 Tax=Sodalis glossinidius TaxID=63612 RepID=UPI000312F0B9|nr:hypothetical protein [Sodalis glossinidius]
MRAQGEQGGNIGRSLARLGGNDAVLLIGADNGKAGEGRPIQPASTIIQPFSCWWPMTVVNTLKAISSSSHTPTLCITKSKKA